MTVWNDPSFTSRLAHANWMSNVAVLGHINERATGDPVREWLGSWARKWFTGDKLRVLVLGCGDGWLERGIASWWPFVEHIDAVDFAAEAVDRARQIAQEQGLTQIAYDVVDLNRATLAKDAYDVIVAHAVLHHVENLEHAFAELHGALRANGTVIVNEYVGPKRFQFSDDVLRILNDLFACLPARLRRGAIEPRVYERRERPTVEQMIGNDPTEAVRSDELAGFIERTFHVVERRNIGGTLLQHLLYDIAHNFRFDVPRERALIEMLCTIEAALVDAKRIPCDFVMLAARKQRGGEVSKDLPPRPEAAKSVDADPLGAGTRKPVVRAASTKGLWLTRPMLRALRIALLATRPSRANLIEESPRAALREQLRFLASRERPFTWIISRWAAHADLKNEDDRAMLMLLEQFDQLHSR
jgi:SAM-dependent methyltransferase